MTTMAFSRDRVEPATTTQASPTASGHAVNGMRDLLRDSALLVATLATGGRAGDFETLRAQCKQLVERFDTALDQRGYARDVRDDAIVAQCALLDETALRYLDDDNKSRWIAEPLQVERLKYHNAGEYVFDRLEMRMREASPRVDLLECYAAVLGLGFMGRYALESKAKRDALIADLNAVIERLDPAQEPVFLIEDSGRRMGDWFQRLSPWVIAGLAAGVALIVWLAWHIALDAQLAAIVPKVVKP